MSRLASFHTPSTPTPSPVQFKRGGGVGPGSPSRTSESTYHRKIRSALQEIRSITETWDELVLIDGLKAARTLVDTRTDLTNALSLLQDALPRKHLVGPKVTTMEKCLLDLDIVISKLEKQFQKLTSVVDGMESTLVEAHKMKGWRWVQEEPLWTTWSLEKFVTAIGSIIPPYHRSLHDHMELVDTFRPHATSFEVGRGIIAKWIEQPWLEEGGWPQKWEDICAVEVEHWNKVK
ncbi:hypothetical protein BDN72DRAFT_842518 [Pluteus cervinus]|uniref:Uncharacterized protein n=1 Tax=Pluteus cervinus TaxID=181527 RepID=A0ACD3ARI6_9AGAR|nr:hypothetical protein BDN72DRAFT_842518 [Pluteus cervinus]